MRKVLTLVTAMLAVSVGVVASTPGAGAQSTPTTTAAAGAGLLRVGTELPAPQFWAGATTQTLTGGFEYELAKSLATKLGYSGVQVVSIPFDTLLAGKAKNYDLALEQVLVTKANKVKVAMSKGYLDFNLGILVRKGTPLPTAATARTWKWGVWTGQAPSASYLTHSLKTAAVPQTYPDLAQAVTALQNSQIDAVLDYTVSVQKQASTSGGKLTVVGQFKTGEQLGVVLPKGSKLVTKVDEAIRTWRSDGTIGKLAIANLGGDPSTVPFVTG